jgi:hypothetical protein
MPPALLLPLPPLPLSEALSLAAPREALASALALTDTVAHTVTALLPAPPPKQRLLLVALAHTLGEFMPSTLPLGSALAAKVEVALAEVQAEVLGAAPVPLAGAQALAPVGGEGVKAPCCTGVRGAGAAGALIKGARSCGCDGRGSAGGRRGE